MAKHICSIEGNGHEGLYNNSTETGCIPYGGSHLELHKDSAFNYNEATQTITVPNAVIGSVMSNGQPPTDNSTNLGTAVTGRWKNIYWSGTLNGGASGSISNASFQGLASVQAGASISLDAGPATASSGNAVLNKQAGTLTSDSLTTAANSSTTLTLANSLVTAGSVIVACVFPGTSTTGNPKLANIAVSGGQVVFTIGNQSNSAALNGTVIVNYIIAKC